MFVSSKKNDNLTAINRYNNFGLRENWIPTLVERREAFFPHKEGHPLGKKMVEAASAWFQQAGLISDKLRVPTALVNYFEKHGSSSILGWELLWMSLANKAILVKWFVTQTEFGFAYSTEQLIGLLGDIAPELSKSTKDGGVSALKDMLTKSPFGTGELSVCLIMKGKQVQSITRKAKNVHPLTVLYGLYLIAEKAGRSSFTVREMMNADIDSLYVSPITAFGIDPDTFKRQCQGLESKYPGFIQCTFTGGLDEVKVFPKQAPIESTGYTHDDVIELALGE